MLKKSELFFCPGKQVDAKIIGEGVRFQRIRRITGYLVGTIDRFNNAKAQELKDRLKHTL